MDDLEAQKIISNSFLAQYGAGFKTLENLINLCPADQWSDKSTGPEIYKIIYHTLYFADLYFSSSKSENDDWTPKYSHAEDFSVSKENFHSREWKRSLTKKEILDYLQEVRIKAQNKIKGLTLEQLTSESIFKWHGPSQSSTLIYNLRHIMLHIGALQARLRMGGVNERFWVSQIPVVE